MTPAQFKPIAKKHDLPNAWLAQRVGHCSARNFRQYTEGRPKINVTVPDAVVKRMQALNKALDKLVA